MKLTFVSNYINHHQIPVSDRLYEALGEGYRFFQTEPMEEERVRMGWGEELGKIPYLRLFYQDEEACRRRIMDSDIVIFGGTQEEAYITERLEAGLPVIRYSERLYREGRWKAVSPRGLRQKYIDHIRYWNSPVYLLCSGAYVASDFDLIHAYPEKKYKWGYFPPYRPYDLDELMEGKRKRYRETGKRRLLWAARFLELKHPEYPIHLAQRLRDRGEPFELRMIGGGQEKERIERMVREKGLQSCVSFPGFLSPEQVRREMELADLFLFTSDYREGWGAVLNEAMNSGCAVVAGHGIGAVPFLVRDGCNGSVYKTGREEEFIGNAVWLLEHPEETERMAREAYHTISTEWNAPEAARRLLALCGGILQDHIEPPASGPLSPAERIAPQKGYAYSKKK